MSVGKGRRVSSKVDALFSETKQEKSEKYSADRIQDLPEPVQRYFNYALPEGQPFISSLRLKHGGEFKMAPDKKWMKIKGKQYFSINPPGFVWIGKTKLFKAIDSYVGEKGNLSVYLFGLFRIVNSRGDAVNQAELLRWLGESVWMPTNLLPGENKIWTPIDDMSAKITFSYQDIDISYTVYFNDEGQIVRMKTKRYKDDNTLVDWEGKVSHYREVNGMMVPSKIEASWLLDEGKYTYARFDVDYFEYDVPRKFQ